MNQLPLQLLASKEGVKKSFIKCTSGNSKGLRQDALLKILLVDRWRHKEHWNKHIKNIVCLFVCIRGEIYPRCLPCGRNVQPCVLDVISHFQITEKVCFCHCRHSKALTVIDARLYFCGVCLYMCVTFLCKC